MKIPGEIPKITGIYEKQIKTGKTEKTTAVAPKKDVISISGQARDIQAVRKALKDVPDIRRDKVNELADKYSSGQYNVNGKDIADSIIRSVFDKKA